MRDPFDYPDHCTEDRIDDIVADILTLEEVCDLPDLERPISDPIPWNPTPPDPDPVICPCFPVNVGFKPKKLNYAENLKPPEIYLSNKNPNNCCEPDIEGVVKWEPPCTPENIDVDFKVVKKSEDAYFKVRKELGNCSYKFDVAVPKGDPTHDYEFKVDIDGETKEVLGCGSPEFKLEGEFETEPVGEKLVRVVLKLRYDLKLPMYSKL